MFAPYKIRVGARAVALALALATSSFSAHAVLERAGPVSADAAVGGFPAWYQDTTGLGLEFCAPSSASEVDGGWCLLLPGDVVAPEVFPTNFFDEHFYFAASVGLDLPGGGRAGLVMAQEAAFAVGAPVQGDQIVFSRIRLTVNPVPATGTYRFIHPYGEDSVDAVVGDKIFYTEDIGVGCANFDCAMHGRMGPFLLPSATPGGAEMPALTAGNQFPDTDPAHFGGAFAPTPYPNNGKAYIADPARIGPVTGSPLPAFTDSTGALRNHNIFRIEGPAGSAIGGVDPVTGAAIDFIESTDFSLMGRVFTGVMAGRTTVERASYTRDAGVQKLDVFATSLPTTSGRMPATARPAAVASSLTYFDQPCAGTVDPLTLSVRPPFSAPPGANEIPMNTEGSLQWAQTEPAVIPSAVCVKDATARNAAGVVVPVYVPAVVTDEVGVTPAFYDPSAGTLTVGATSSDAVLVPTLTMAYAGYAGDMVGGAITQPGLLAPPANVTVLSSALGSARYNVSTGFKAAAPAPLPAAVNDSFTMLMNSATQILDVLANDSNVAGGTVSLTANSALGTAVLNADNTISYTPNLNAVGQDAFSYTVTVGGQVSNIGLATITINSVPVAPVANNDATNAVQAKLQSINVLGNDTDANGPLDIVAPQIVAGPVGATAVVNGRNIDFTAAATGTYTFSYQAVDAAGLSSNTATVTVQVGAAESITFAQALYETRKARLRVSGTLNPAAGQTIVLKAVNSAGIADPSPFVIGSVTVDALGNFAFSQNGVSLPADKITVVATTSNGYTQANALTFK
ncbi:MAG: cadherin-like domain-containing protein [Burkholderiales bacterium]|nr:cadherin-like domain-containing protein [Burkholderiales bacterium]